MCLYFRDLIFFFFQSYIFWLKPQYYILLLLHSNIKFPLVFIIASWASLSRRTFFWLILLGIIGYKNCRTTMCDLLHLILRLIFRKVICNHLVTTYWSNFLTLNQSAWQRQMPTFNENNNQSVQEQLHTQTFIFQTLCSLCKLWPNFSSKVGNTVFYSKCLSI